jgi:hypothetical protein
MAKRSSKSSLFLMEMIIGIMFLAIASAVCLRLFVGAHLVQETSGDTMQAVMMVQSVAEQMKLADSPLTYLETLGAVSPEAGVWEVFFAEDWQPTTAATAAFCLRFRGEESGELWRGELGVERLRDGKEVFSIDWKKHSAGGRDGG